jgi:hypothetical protein
MIEVSDSKTPNPEWLRLLASFEFLGGICCVVGAFLPQDSPPGSFRWYVVFFPLLAGAVAALAGFLIMVREPIGLKLSYYVQLAQVISFTSAWRYLLVVGPRVSFNLSTSVTQFLWGAAGMGIATTAPPDDRLTGIGINLYFGLDLGGPMNSKYEWTIGVNFLAAYFAYRLWEAMGSAQADEVADVEGPAS